VTSPKRILERFSADKADEKGSNPRDPVTKTVFLRNVLRCIFSTSMHLKYR
jgi:hypothetical protein